MLSVLAEGVLLPKRPPGLVLAKSEVRGLFRSNKLFAVVVVDDGVVTAGDDEDAVSVSMESSSSPFLLLLLGWGSAFPDETIDPSFMWSLLRLLLLLLLALVSGCVGLGVEVVASSFLFL